MQTRFAFGISAVLLGSTAGCGGGAPPVKTEGEARAAVAPPSPPPSAPEHVSGATPPQTGTLEVTVRVKPEVADSLHPTEFQSSRLVGHYSTPNGKVGFVLDRTSDPPRLRLDGESFVLGLTPRPASRGWLEYVASNVWIRVSEETGAILSFSGPNMKEASRVVRDADARPLPPLR